MIVRIIILFIFLLSYILFTVFQDKINCPKTLRKIILIVLSIIIIPWAVAEVTGFRASKTIEDLNNIISSLNQKVELLSGQLISQDTVLKDISSKIIVALENECLKDLEERKNVIKQLHDNTFQMSKNTYDSMIDTIFDEVRQLKEKGEKLSTEQKRLSDESLIYFELLTNYVLDIFDSLISQLKQKNEVLSFEINEIPEKYIYADNGKSIVIRDVQLKDNKRIRFKITNRKLDKKKLVSLPSIGIIGNEQSPRISISGPPIEELKIGPQPLRITGWRGQVLDIKYPLGEDPLMSESFRDNIDQKISEFIKLLYF